MIAATTVVRVDVFRDWLDGFCLPGLRRFRLANSPDAQEEPISMICEMPAPVQLAFNAKGGPGWPLWTVLVETGIEARQLPPAQIKALAITREHKARRIELMPNSSPALWCLSLKHGRRHQLMNLRIFRSLTTLRP